jgi:hypothetical protein
LDLQRQAVHPTPHVGMSDSQPNPGPRRNQDHRPTNALPPPLPIRPGSSRDAHARLRGKLDFVRVLFRNKDAKWVVSYRVSWVPPTFITERRAELTFDLDMSSHI